MSDLTGGSASAAIGRAGDGGARAPASGAGSAQGTSSRMRTPRDVMNERQAREARRRAEAEDEARNDQQSRIELERRRSAQRRAAAAAAQTRDSGYRSAAASAGGRTPAQPTYSNIGGSSGMAARGPSESIPPTIPESSASAMRPDGSTARASGSSSIPQQPVAIPASYTQQSQAQAQPAQSAVPTSQTSRGPQSSSQVQPSGDAGQSRSNTSSFPHAFERWESLSSHWEGLTSYWIRKLEMNTEAIRRENDISREQMSRQITDLSAAGANLFHAVVELQRLRASSERKFQRWFFDTRSRQERDDEERQRLQNELDTEREKSSTQNPAIQAEMERRYAEMRRELQISREEARRAWEELGRREQEERDRQLALREGHPIFVGGVQVLPMSAVSRGGSVQQGASTRDPAYATPGGPSGEEYELREEPSPTDTDPFTSQDTRPAQPPTTTRSIHSSNIPSYQSGAQAMSTSGSTAQQAPTSTSSGFYRQPETYLHDPALTVPPAPRSAFSEGSEEDPPAPEIDAQGNIRYDTQGRPIPFRPSAAAISAAGSSTAAAAATYPTIPGASTIRAVPPQAGSEPNTSDDEYDVATDVAREREAAARYLQQGQRPAPGSPQDDPQQDPADYEGEGFGSGTGWEAIPRHQHPTRLSDVLEEDDERSRASLGSGGGPRY